MPPAKRNRASPTGNALLYILLFYVDLIASFTSSAILNDLFAICNSRLLPTNQIVNCDGRVRPIQGAPCFCVYFYHDINLRRRCHSNRQGKVNLIKCSVVGYN